MVTGYYQLFFLFSLAVWFSFTLGHLKPRQGPKLMKLHYLFSTNIYVPGVFQDDTSRPNSTIGSCSWYTGGGVPEGSGPEDTTSLETSEAAPVAGKESSRCGVRGAGQILALRLLVSPGLRDSARRIACSNRPALPRDRGLTSAGSSSSIGGMSSSTSSRITTRGISK